MKLFNDAVVTVVALSLLVGVLVGGYYVAAYVINYLMSVEEKQLEIIVMSILTGLLVIMLSSMVTKRKQIRNKHNQMFMNKVDVYVRFIKEWSINLSHNIKSDSSHDSIFEDGFYDLERELMLVANDEVLKAYIEFKECEDDPETKKGLIGRFILEVRKDIGNSNIGINQDDLSLMFLDMTKDKMGTRFHSEEVSGHTGVI